MMNRDKLALHLDYNKIEFLINLYHNHDHIAINNEESNYDSELLDNLIVNNLVRINISGKKNLLSLSNEGLNICKSVMFNIINNNKDDFRTKIQKLPERAVVCIVNRIMCRDIVGKEKGFIDSITKPYVLDESLWYERVLLKDKKMQEIFEKMYVILEKVGFIKTIDDQRWCSPEVEEFLKKEYREFLDLSWVEEDSLKYYYFFYVYAQDQKNLIDFSGDGEYFHSMFFDKGSSPPDYWFSSNRSNPHMLLSSLDLSEKRIMDFLTDMNNKNIVSETYYPLSSFSFFSEDDRIFVIKDIKRFMDYITSKFLTPVVDSLLK